MTQSHDLFSHPWIVGPGRLGLALATLLSRNARVGRLTVSGRRVAAPAHTVFGLPNVAYTATSAPPPFPSLVLIAVPDEAISGVAGDLSSLDLPPVPVLHTSGVRSGRSLSTLRDAGHPTGSLHPLAALSGSPSSELRLEGAFFGVDGDPLAVRAGREIVQILKGRTLEVDATQKVVYHAAAVFASNYVVTLLAVGERLMAQAGVTEADARDALAELARGAIANVADTGPARALTGPVSRGDTDTVERHLGGLSAQDRRLYSELARSTLELARQQGLDAAAAARIDATLLSGPS